MRQFCTFYLKHQFFGVPVEQVQEVIRYQQMTRVPLVPPAVRGLINLRGQIVTAIDLRRSLGIGDRPESQLPMNVVVRAAEGAVSFMVDEIGDVVEVNESTFELPPQNVQSPVREVISGVHKLDDQVMLVLDVTRACLLHNQALASIQSGSQTLNSLQEG